MGRAGMVKNFTVTRRIFAAACCAIWGTVIVFANPAGAQQSVPIEIVGFGDSLMAGYELPAEQGFTAQLESALKAKGHAVTVTNAGVSGDTSSDGAARLDWSVPDSAKLVILEMGANDALRGVTPDLTRKNLEVMIQRLNERKIAIVLAGILAPPNMGKDYEAVFNPIFPDLAAQYNLPLIPFFLDGVAGHPELQLEDAMHPNAVGVKVMVDKTMAVIEPQVKRLLASQ